MFRFPSPDRPIFFEKSKKKKIPDLLVNTLGAEATFSGYELAFPHASSYPENVASARRVTSQRSKYFDLQAYDLVLTTIGMM